MATSQVTSHKLDGSEVATFLNWNPRFDWYMVK